MKFLKIIPLFLTLAFQNLTFSQAEIGQSNEKTSSVLSEYFKLDRENIHLHLNKNVFLPNDEIWFKGYIIEKKSKKGYSPTSNVNIALLDEKGTKLKTYLFYAENSTFEGNIKLDKNTTTGIYYLQVYTNYMNNFAEDESSVFEFKIINPNDGKTIPNTKTLDINTLTTEFFPESNVFLVGTSNTIAIKITDCNGKGLSITDGEIKDSKGVTVTNFRTNELGYGKFEILQTKNELYKAIFKIDDSKTEKSLPMPTAKGITFSVNNYTFEDKTTLKIKTNARSLDEYKNETLTLVTQQDNYNSLTPFTLKENSTEQLFILSNENFKPGINVLYLIDKNQKKIAERILYKPSNLDQNITLKVLRKQNDSIIISGTSTLPMATLSVSVLPTDTKTLTSKKTICDSFVLDNQLSEKTPNESYFLTNFSKRKHYELDTYLICQKSKYNWETMLTSSPKNKFDFDSGLTLKGTINIPVKDKNYKVQMKSILSGLNEFSELNEKNEFYFKNILVSDSTLIHFSLLNKKNQRIELKSTAQVLNNNRTFIKPFKTTKSNCLETKSNNTESPNFHFPKIAKAIQLDTISIGTKEKKIKLTNQKKYHNSMAKGYKITEADDTRDVLQFIAASGYDVSIGKPAIVDSLALAKEAAKGNLTSAQGLTVTILSRRPSSFLATRAPLIYIDDTPITDFSWLLNYSLSRVDEIYVNKNGYGEGMEAHNGVIRIYTKKTFSKNIGPRINSQSFLVKNGFEKLKRFTNPKYTSYNDEGFVDFGTIHWEPNVETDENGIFKFSFPNYYQKTAKVVIEGIASDGQIISETKIIEIP
ncbi:hypothetical protein FEDK69T_15010 [Flavobacterium enshiense DK69]|uniref:TonB-dependent receptor plug domain-containing protein n=1 Tax=Flavobacterium enshiense DK69 TaxID=1107311 RepID=V6SA70_9FLAO|nr:hypothetical protein [Flavobacterium enshiense]ESU23339.1 hypothetical protein FEDK69T_15010 [Flavobacterium enshiense DK69]KGO96428.1 hypothetical protein Q767_05850 [Flavobacterium enshiense DK69]